MTSAPLKTTALNAVHRALGGKMVDFEGWDMPVQYSGVLDEHNTVRNAVGLFDVSHMGEIEIKGPEAAKFANTIGSNDVAKLQPGQIHYSGLLYDSGTFVDDILVHKISEQHIFICVNAGNQDKDYEHIRSLNRHDCEVEFASPRYSQLAVQGPRALATVQKLTAIDLSAIHYYWFTHGVVAGLDAMVARTGYTGEDGVEIYVDPGVAVDLWGKLIDAGAEFGIKPCGLGARNTLRLEAKMALYGHEIDATITPYEADLAWIVKLGKGCDFTGRDALIKQKTAGVTRKLAAFEMRGRGIGRDGYEVHIAGQPAGWVTSGSPSPTLNKNIGLCYLPADRVAVGQTIEVIVRSQPVEAQIVPAPFYKRAK